jgi:uncharacterized protein
VNSAQKGYALVTGASKGIGKEIAVQLAAKGFPLVLVARSENLMKQMQSELQSTYKVNVEIYAGDLGAPEMPQQLAEWCRAKQLPIQILINNAGFGNWDKFEKANLAEVEEMTNLNVVSLMRMCHAFIPLLREQKQAWLMNVGSLGALQPLPFKAAYGAGKAFVRQFTFALRNELKGSSISVTCLSPGGVWTSFADREGDKRSHEKAKNVMITADRCARVALRAMFRGRSESIPGWYNHIFATWSKFMPLLWSAKFARRVFEKND